MTEGVQYAGEFNLQQASLFSPNGEITDLLTDVALVEINLYEDIFKNSMSGSLVIADTKNIITKLPIIGQEKLSLKILTPSLTEKEDIIDFSENYFSVYKVNNTTEISSGARAFELHFISTESIRNTRKRVSKSYVNTKANIGEIVFDLLAEDINGIQTSKEVFVEETVGTRNIVIPNSHPYTAVTRLTKEAVSKSGSPHYVFFENKNGLHFVSLQSLYEKEVRAKFHGGEKATNEEYMGGDPDSGRIPQAYRRIIDYNINTKKDLLINSSAGMFGGRVIEHNIFSKKFAVKTFNYFDDEDFQSNIRTENGRVYSTNVLGKMDDQLNEEVTNSKISLIPTSKDRNDVDKAFEKGTPNRQYDTLLARQSRLLELHDGISINMTVHGFTGLTVGDMVKVSLPTLGDKEDGEENKIYSGTYLIRRLKHRFSIAQMHLIDMELVKDGFSEELLSGEDEVNKKAPTGQPTIVSSSDSPSKSKSKTSTTSSPTTPNGDQISNVSDSSKGKLARKISAPILDDDPEFQAKLAEMEKKYPGKGFSKQKLYKTIKGESAFDTGARNKNTDASGLFQFTQPAVDDINKKFGTNHTLQGIRNMGATEQLGVYDQYLDMWKYDGNNELGIMQGAPAFAKRSANTQVYRTGGKAWKQNPGWRDSSGNITVASMNAYYLKQA